MARTSETTYIQVSGARLRETDKAVQFHVCAVAGKELEIAKKEWFPFSQCARSLTDPSGQEPDTLDVAEWILKSKGLL